MPEGKSKMLWAAANARAERLVGQLADVCLEIHVAGSIRRKETLVGDVELVALPMREDNLLGEPGESLLDRRLAVLARNSVLTGPHKSGERYKQYSLRAPDGAPAVQLDLFIASPDNLGLILALRTGPAAFSRRLVATVNIGGYLRDGFVIDDGRVWRGRRYDERSQLESPGEMIPVPTERRFFQEVTTCGWIEPHERK